MLFHIITSVWGERHVDLFLDLTLPSILSARNLPSLAERGEIVYRFFTTPSARARIEAGLITRRLRAIARVEYVIPLGDATPAADWHVHWNHRSAAEAKLAGAIVFFIPPDTLWTNGSLEHMANLIAAGWRGVASPFIEVASETTVHEARTRFLDPESGALTIEPTAMWPFARRHVHPLHALAVPGGPHARAAFFLHWPVGEQGTISRYAFRELTAFDPRRCPITSLWYPDGPEDAEGVYFVGDSDEMLMLSVDPVSKYLDTYIIRHSCHPFDLACITLHPLNDNQQARVFASQAVRMHSGSIPVDGWRRTELQAKAAARDIMVGRAAMLLCRELEAHRCVQSASLLSIALRDTHLSRRWRHDRPLTVIASTDAALSRELGSAALTLAGHGCNRELVNVIRDHVIPGHLHFGQLRHSLGGTTVCMTCKDEFVAINDVPVTCGPIEIEGIDLFITDGIVAASLQQELGRMQEGLQKTEQATQATLLQTAFRQLWEAQRLAQEEAQRRAQEEAQRLAQEEAQRLAQEEAQRRAQEEAQRLAQEEAQPPAQEEPQPLAQTEAQRMAQEEAQRLAQIEAQLVADIEAECRRGPEEQ